MSLPRLPIATILVGLFWLLLVQPSYAQEPLSVHIAFSKTFYTPAESLAVDVKVANNLGRPLTGTSTTLAIYPRLDRFMPLREAPTDGVPLLRRTWYGSISPGEVGQHVDRRLSDLGAQSGVYQVSAKFNSREGYSAESTGYLVVLDDNQPKLPVVVMLGTAYPLQKDPDGLFVSERLFRQLVATEGRAGSLAQILETLKAHPELQITPVWSPQTLISLQQMASGYRVKVSGRDGKTKESKGGDGKEAARFISTMRELLKRPGAEAFFYPYGQASLAQLETSHLAASIPAQIIQGWKTVNGIFAGAKVIGICTTDLSLGTTFLNSLPNEAPLALASASQVGADTSATPAPVAMSGENGRATVLPVDDELAGLISESPPAELRTKLTAALALRAMYGENPPQHAVTIFLNHRGSIADGQSIKIVADTLTALPWLAPTTPSQAANTSQEKHKTSLSKPAAKASAEYMVKLRRTAAELATLTSNVPIVSDTVRNLERQLLVSEDSFFVSGGGEPGLGDSYLSWMRTKVQSVYDAVQVDRSHHITFSSSQGKIPIAIRNNNNFPLLANIALKGKGAFQFDDKIRTVRLNPKDNLVTLSVKADYVGTRTIKAIVTSGNTRLGTSDIEITVNSYVRYFLALAGFAIASLMLAVALGRRQRKT